MTSSNPAAPSSQCMIKSSVVVTHKRHKHIKALENQPNEHGKTIGNYGNQLRSSKCDFSNVTICFYDEHELNRDSCGNYIRFQLPVSYTAATQEFELFGCFCSLECARAFLYQQHQRPLLKLEKIQTLLPLYTKKLFGTQSILAEGRHVTRPHKFALQRYGGPMNISDFRSEWCNSIKYAVYRMMPALPRFRQVQVIVDEYMYPNNRAANDSNTGSTVAPTSAVSAFPTAFRAVAAPQEQSQQSRRQKQCPGMSFPLRKMPVHMKNQTLAALMK